MNPRSLPLQRLRTRLASPARAVAMALLTTTTAWAALPEAAPRSARLDPVEGSVALAVAGEREWMDARRGRNLQRGDRLWVDPRSRAEVQVGRDLLRLEGPAHLHLAELTVRSTQLNLTQGTLQVRVRTPLDAHHFDLNTPNLAFRAEQSGDYRVDVDRARNTTRVAVLSGRGTAYGASGQRLPIAAGQQAEFGGTALARQGEVTVVSTDAFSRWSAGRDQSATAPAPPSPVPRATTAVAGGPRVQGRPAPAAPSIAPPPAPRVAAATVGGSPRTEVRPRPAAVTNSSAPPSAQADSARREAWQREQAALAQQWKQDHAAFEARRAGQGIAILRQPGVVSGRP